MKVVLGLGNVGSKYDLTRHNIGFMFLDYLRDKFEFEEFVENPKLKSLITSKEIAGEKVLLVKPTTYMNLSGEALVAIKNFYKLELDDFVICFDDVDLEFGEVRWRIKGSAGTHNGVKSILSLAGSSEVKRVKLGIDNSGRFADLSAFVLAKFSQEELMGLKEVFENALAKVDFLT